MTDPLRRAARRRRHSVCPGVPSGLILRRIPKSAEAVQALIMRAGIASTSGEQIASGLRRSLRIAAHHRSTCGAPRLSLPPPTAAALPRSCAGPANRSRWCGPGRRGSWRRASKGCCATRRASLVSPAAAQHRIRTFKLSKDPEFVEKLRGIVGLYVDPPAHAVVLSVDEKSQIQALDRTQPGLPMKKGRDKRHGTTTLFAALNVLDGTVIGRNMQRHRHQEFIRAGANGDPRRRRQLRDPQTFQGTKMAGPASPLDVSLHAYLGVMAQRRRRLLRQTHETAPQAWSVPVGCRPSGCNQPVRRRNQLRSQTLRLDR